MYTRVFKGVFVLALLSVMVLLSTKSQAATKQPFSEIVTGDLLTYIYAPFSEEEMRLFSSRLSELSNGRVVTTGISPERMNEVSAFIFILRDWSDIKVAPFQGEFEMIYNDVLTAGTDTHHIRNVFTSSDHSFMVSIFNLNKMPSVSIECLAFYFVSSLNGSSVNNFEETCKVQ